jgi:hypothetical protein
MIEATPASSSRRCRVCGSIGVRLVLDLGIVPLANSFVVPEEAPEAESTHALGIQFCPACAIVQIPELVDPEILFRHYLYTPSASSTWRDHCDELAAWLRDEVGDPGAFVVEPASNDGCLLRSIQRWTPNVLGPGHPGRARSGPRGHRDERPGSRP